jgi:hypothetical protein
MRWDATLLGILQGKIPKKCLIIVANPPQTPNSRVKMGVIMLQGKWGVSCALTFNL